MVTMNAIQMILDDFAQILDYPTAVLPEIVGRSTERLRASHAGSADHMTRFQSFIDENDEGKLQELYTGTFDLQAFCNLYVGHYLFGEDFRRSLFMVKLKELYREEDFSFQKELPDHLCVMLRFLACAKEREENRELISECVIPAVVAMLKCFDSKHHPYKAVLQSLLLVLQEDQEQDPETLRQHDKPQPGPSAR